MPRDIHFRWFKTTKKSEFQMFSCRRGCLCWYCSIGAGHVDAVEKNDGYRHNLVFVLSSIVQRPWEQCHSSIELVKRKYWHHIYCLVSKTGIDTKPIFRSGLSTKKYYSMVVFRWEMPWLCPDQFTGVVFKSDQSSDEISLVENNQDRFVAQKSVRAEYDLLL